MNDEPTKINKWGTKIWLNSKGQIHRDHDLPAVIYSNGACVWYQNDKLHRDNDLPAEMFPNGKCQWWVNDKFIKKGICTQKEIEEYKKSYREITQVACSSNVCKCNIIHLWNYGHEAGCPLKK